ncbi:MAG: hypothetical protein IJY61_06665 [Candidatus Gastranaerophilales bacterium]|nr:hypothetical protein [Candidatus Gastranaerophilales bacterium]
MSFTDAIGKLQSVIASLGTEETKKIEKKEDVSESSLFKSSIEDVNEETDITGIEIDYSQAADEVSEQLFTNREIHRNNNDAKEWSQRLDYELENANISEFLKEELAPLYNELCEATDANVREKISAEIKHKYLEAEANGATGTDFEKLDLDLQRFSSLSAQGKAVSELYEQLAEVDDYEMKNKIYAQIDKTNADFSAEQEKLFMQSYIREFDLSDEQVDGLSDWYSKLSETTDEDARAKIQAEIKKYCAEQGIDSNSEMILGLDLSVAQLSRMQDLSLLYEEAMHTNSDKQLDMIYREINLKNTEHLIKNDEMEQKMILSDMGLDDETKQKVLELFDKLSGVNDRSNADKINAEIAQELAEAGVDLSGRDYALLQLTNTNLQMEKENLEIYEELMYTTNPEKINDLNIKLQNIYESYENEFDNIHEKINNIDEANFVENLGEMYEDLSNATSAEDRNAIKEHIQDMIDDKNKEILEQKIFDSYFDLYDVDSEAEKSQKIAEIQSLHAEYGEMQNERKLSDLYDKLSEAKDANSRDVIRAEIRKIENEINQKAELESLYEQLAECESIGEREKILAKIKELE